MAGTAKKIEWITRMKKEHKLTGKVAETLFENINPFKTIKTIKAKKMIKVSKPIKNASKTNTRRRAIK